MGAGKGLYRNHLLETESYRRHKAANEIGAHEFGTLDCADATSLSVTGR